MMTRSVKNFILLAVLTASVAGIQDFGHGLKELWIIGLANTWVGQLAW